MIYEFLNLLVVIFKVLSQIENSMSNIMFMLHGYGVTGILTLQPITLPLNTSTYDFGTIFKTNEIFE